MTPINRSYTYHIKDGHRLRLRIRWEGYDIYVSTGYSVNVGKWNGTRCVNNSSHGSAKIPAHSVNRALDLMEDAIGKIFYEFEIADHIPDAAEMHEAIDIALGRKIVDIRQSWEEFIHEGEERRQWAVNTVKSVRQVRNLLFKFRPNLKFNDLNLSLLEEFAVYQQTEKLSEKTFRNGSRGYSNNVIRKNCRILNWFLKWAWEKRYIRIDLARSFKPELKTIDRPVIFLTWPELMRVYSLDLSSEAHDLTFVRDVFCFSCFTSLRYSDAVALMKTQVYENHIAITTIKTASNLRIDLNRYSKAILERYRDLPGGKALPYVTNHRMNTGLKIIGRLAGIDSPVTVSQFYGNERKSITLPKHELLTSHCGRRTFICNALEMDIPPHVVMKWTGHSAYEAMKPYIDVTDHKRKDAMKKFDEM